MSSLAAKVHPRPIGQGWTLAGYRVRDAPWYWLVYETNLANANHGVTRMKKINLVLAALVMFAMFACATAAVAGEVYARCLTTMGTSTNASWTVGKYERPTVVRVDCVGMVPVSTTTEVAVAYGDAAAGSRVLGTIVTDSSGNGTLLVTNSSYLLTSDVLTMGRRNGTNGAWRVHYIQRDTRTLN